jgi:cbb3-type cytochrome oxidase maturation protein
MSVEQPDRDSYTGYLTTGHGLASFMWTVKNDQYDDLEGAAERILFVSNDKPD